MLSFYDIYTPLRALIKGSHLTCSLFNLDCPKCKMRYSLAKGGCMHFKCTQCGHEFCCGCNRPFLHRGACKELESCESQGLHCHHPRDCLYYLRDSDVAQLQQLLEVSEITLTGMVSLTHICHLNRHGKPNSYMSP